MTSADYQSSIIAPEAPFYTARALNTGNHHQGYYPAALPVGGTAETLSGLQSQPRALYRASSNQVYSTNEYSSTDGNPGSSSSASFIASRAGSYDSSFPQSVTPESSGLGTQVDAYSNYMYSHSGQGPTATGLVSTPPAMSPKTGHQHQQQQQQQQQQHQQKKNKAASSRQQRKSKHQQQQYHGFSPEPTAGNRSKLRSASRTSKNTHHNPPVTVEERKSRETHNNVEKQYRNRLNAHFESLLSALPDRMQAGDGEDGDEGGDNDVDFDPADRRVSKAEVLEMARRHIKSLERECAVLESERDELRDNMEKLRWLFGRCENGAGGPEAASAFLDQASM
jgi:hypothetical protein